MLLFHGFLKGIIPQNPENKGLRRKRFGLSLVKASTMIAQFLPGARSEVTMGGVFFIVLWFGSSATSVPMAALDFKGTRN
jgi:hypothetical protein